MLYHHAKSKSGTRTDHILVSHTGYNASWQSQRTLITTKTALAAWLVHSHTQDNRSWIQLFSCWSFRSSRTLLQRVSYDKYKLKRPPPPKQFDAKGAKSGSLPGQLSVDLFQSFCTKLDLQSNFSANFCHCHKFMFNTVSAHACLYLYRQYRNTHAAFVYFGKSTVQHTIAVVDIQQIILGESGTQKNPPPSPNRGAACGPDAFSDLHVTCKA